jgi:hypothetical protein
VGWVIDERTDAGGYLVSGRDGAWECGEWWPAAHEASGPDRLPVGMASESLLACLKSK